MGGPWLLDPTVTYLNHGSFGACPRPVVEEQWRWRERMETEPIRFLDDELEGLLDATRAEVGAAIGADPAGLAFVPNATTAVNTVLAGVELRPGDEVLVSDQEYGACINAARRVATHAGARLVVANVPFPVADAGLVVERLLGAVTPRTRLVIVSHITSTTALRMPLEELVPRFAERGVEVLVDGAHGPGQVPLDLNRLAAAGMAWYAGDGHKWWCAPRGSGFLWVREDCRAGTRPLVTSHGASSPRTDRPRFLLEFDWTGTLDPSPWLSMPAAIRFLASLAAGGIDEVMMANHGLVLQGRDVVCEALGIDPPVPDPLLGAMAAMPVPVRAGEGSTLHRRLFDERRIEVPVSTWPGAAVAPAPGTTLELLRISAQRYDHVEEYRQLADALRDLLGGIR